MNRPTHIGIETRLTVDEADALQANLPMFASMIRNRVCHARQNQLEAALISGLEKLQREIEQRAEPFDTAINQRVQRDRAFREAIVAAGGVE